MKYIKKVDVTQLVTNTGTIIDSMNSGDNPQTNAPSISAVKDYVENYSTSETKIGTWIDGKPIYRKVIQFNSTFPAGDTHISHNINNINIVVRHELICDNGPYQFPYVNAQAKITTFIQVTSTEILIRNTNTTSFDNTSKPYTVILEYTKTTD